MTDLELQARALDALLVAMQRVLATNPDTTPEERWHGELLIPRFAEIAGLLRELDADWNEETAARIDALYAEVRVFTAAYVLEGPPS